MKKYRRLLVLAAVLLIGGVAVIGNGFGGVRPEDETLKIGISVYKKSDVFLTGMLSAMEDYAKEYELEHDIKVELNILDASENQTIQNDQIKNFISLEYDVICVNLVDRTSASDIVENAIEADIPLVFFNREPTEEDIMGGEHIYYVGTDARDTAMLQGEMVINQYQLDPDSLDRNGNGVIEYVMLEGERGHQDAMIRSEWSVQALQESGLQLQKLNGATANWDRSQAAAIMEGWLNEYGQDIELVICNNDDMALGAMDALKEYYNNYYEVQVVGIDGIPEALSAIDSGYMLGTVICDLEKQAEAIFALARCLGTGTSIPAEIQLENERYVRVPLKIRIKE